MAVDINLICNTSLTTGAEQGKCRCRTNFKWNTAEGECQVGVFFKICFYFFNLKFSLIVVVFGCIDIEISSTCVESSDA